MKTFAEWPLFSLLTGIVLAKTDSTGRVQNVVVAMRNQNPPDFCFQGFSPFFGF